MNASSINDMHDPEFRKLLAQEELILEVTETICDLLEEEKISRKELAERLGKSKGFVSQLLNGGRNLTLRTVADILHVLAYKITLKPEKLRASNVIELFAKSQTTYQSPTATKYMHGAKLKYSSKADNYHNNQKAITG